MTARATSLNSVQARIIEHEPDACAVYLGTWKWPVTATDPVPILGGDQAAFSYPSPFRGLADEWPSGVF